MELRNTKNDYQTRPGQTPRISTRRRRRRPGSLRQLFAARPPVERAAAAQQDARARRALVHHPAPGRGAVVQADPSRARRGDGVPAPRSITAQHQDPEPRETGAAPAHQPVVGARDADADGILGIPRRARQRIGIPVAAVSAARVQARQQGPRAVVALQPSPRVLPAAQSSARASEPLRRVPALFISRGSSRAGRARRARLERSVRAPSRRRRGAADRVSAPGPILGGLRSIREAGRHRDQLPVVALPSHEDGGAHHRRENGKRRHDVA